MFACWKLLLPKAHAALDSGAPVGGLIYVDYPRMLSVCVSWTESPHNFYMERFMDVEMAGHVFSEVLIVRHKHWNFADYPEPVIGGHLLTKFALSLVGSEVLAHELQQVPLELRNQRGQVVLHNATSD